MAVEALEQKKSLRKASFRLTSLGIEQKAEDKQKNKDGQDVPPEREEWKKIRERYDELLKPKGWSFAERFEDMQGRTDENFIAVVHIDGNSMGKRVKNLYDSETESWDACCDKLRCFSEGIQHDFEAAFREMAAEVPITRPPIPQETPASFRYVRLFLPVMMCALSRAAVWVWNVPNGL